MSYRIYFERIHKASVAKDYNEVRQILDMRLFTYREAQLYSENIKKDYKAGKYILKQATCKCGRIVTSWEFRKTPTCNWCKFNKSTEKIEYGPEQKQKS